MLQVLNAKERNQAFIQFLFFLLITIGLVIGAIYFDFGLPTKEQELLRNEITIQRVQNLNQEKFVAQMEQAKMLSDSLDKSGVNQAQVDMQLTGKFTELERFRQKDSTLYGKLNTVVVQALLELQQTKNELIKLREQAQIDKDVKAELKEYKAQLSELQVAIATMNAR